MNKCILCEELNQAAKNERYVLKGKKIWGKKQTDLSRIFVIRIKVLKKKHGFPAESKGRTIMFGTK